MKSYWRNSHPILKKSVPPRFWWLDHFAEPVRIRYRAKLNVKCQPHFGLYWCVHIYWACRFLNFSNRTTVARTPSYKSGIRTLYAATLGLLATVLRFEKFQKHIVCMMSEDGLNVYLHEKLCCKWFGRSGFESRFKPLAFRLQLSDLKNSKTCMLR